jgi:hypothetical protein
MHRQLLGSAALLQNNTISTSQLDPGPYELEVQCRPDSFCTAQPSHLRFTRLSAETQTSSAGSAAEANLGRPDDQFANEAPEMHALSAEEANSAEADVRSKIEDGAPAAEKVASSGRSNRGNALISKVQISEALVTVVHNTAGGSSAASQESVSWAKYWVQGAVVVCFVACQVCIVVLS